MTKASENPHVDVDHDEQQDEAAKLFMQVAKGEDLDPSSDNDGAQADEQLDPKDEEKQAQDGEQQGNDQDDDPLADLPEPVRERFNALQQQNQTLQQQYQSIHGRLAPTQRELEALKRQLSEQQGKAKQPAEQQPTAEEIAGMTDDELEAEWPEVAAALKKREQRLQQDWERKLDEKLSPFQKWQQEQQAQAEEQAIQSELSRLAEAHPDFQEYPSNPQFNQWLTTQPPGIQQLAGSLFAADNIALLNLYKSATGKGQQQKPAQPAQRNKDLSRFAEVPRKGSGQRMPADPNSVDPAALFMQIAQSKE